MDKRAESLKLRVDGMVKEAFELIATQVFIHSPVWSSQSVVNWTASVGKTPSVRLVHIDKKNTGIKNNKITGGGEADKKTAIIHNSELEMAPILAARAAIMVSKKYKSSKKPGTKNDSIWLSNAVSYTPKLWTGKWPSNRVSLKSAVSAGVPAVERFRILGKFR